MITTLRYLSNFSLYLYFLTFSVCNAIEVIRTDFKYQGNIVSVDISLFDNIATNTVNNFLKYVDDDSYNNLFINRSISGFILQGGGYTYDPLLNDGSFSYSGNAQFNGGLQPVASKGEIRNEFKLSNLKGTLAMAKINNQPHSATREWFINVTNNVFLDSTNEGFTVFGEVIGDGMTSIDLISSLPVFDLTSDISLGSAFSSVPLTEYPATSSVDDITSDKLISVDRISRLFNITDIINVGDAVANTTVQRDIIIQNNHSTEMQIGTIDTTVLTPPFSVLDNPCENTILQLTEQCIIQIEFSPLSADFFASSMDIEIATYEYTFPILLKTPSPEIIAVPNVIDFGKQPVFDPPSDLPKQEVIRINNRGNKTLNISSVTFDTEFLSEFEFIDNCTANSAHQAGTVPSGELCVVIVNFKPSNISLKSAIITIISDDPLNDQLIIEISGGVDSDNDGIDKETEDAAPHSGDGNFDGLPDKLQDNVVSFPNINGSYTTLVTNENLLFTNVELIPLSADNQLPQNLILANGAFSFKLSGIELASISEFGLILPAGDSETPTNLYVFGTTVDRSTPHWYPLVKNNVPGVFIFNNTLLTDPIGNSTHRNIATVLVQDGGNGDSDRLINGEILFIGGAEITDRSSNGSGLTLWTIFLISILTTAFRKFY